MWVFNPEPTAMAEAPPLRRRWLRAKRIALNPEVQKCYGISDTLWKVPALQSSSAGPPASRPRRDAAPADDTELPDAKDSIRCHPHGSAANRRTCLRLATGRRGGLARKPREDEHGNDKPTKPAHGETFGAVREQLHRRRFAGAATSAEAHSRRSACHKMQP